MATVRKRHEVGRGVVAEILDYIWSQLELCIINDSLSGGFVGLKVAAMF